MQLKLTTPKWLRRQTIDERATQEIADAQREMYNVESRIEVAVHEKAFLEAKIKRLSAKVHQATVSVVQIHRG